MVSLPPFEERVIDRHERIEVLVQRGRLDAEPSGDLRQGEAVDALSGHDLLGDVEDLLDGLAPPPGPTVQPGLAGAGWMLAGASWVLDGSSRVLAQDEVERFLIEIANSPDSVSPGEVREIQQRIGSGSLLFKVRIIESNLRTQGQKL